MMRCRVLVAVVAPWAALVLGGCYAQTEPAGDVGSASATLNAHGFTVGRPGQASFQYSTAKNALGTGFGLQTPTLTFPPNASGPFTAKVSGLSHGTNYFFRVCGNDIGDQPHCNRDLEFTTTVPGAAAAFGPPLSTVGAGVVAAGDFNGDGDPDLVVEDGDSATSVHVVLGHGDGTFGDAGAADLGVLSGSPLAVGDFTRDGEQDLLVQTGTGVEVFPGRGDGTLGRPSTTSISAGASTPGGVVAGDFNRDGRRDIALIRASQAASPVSVAQVMLGNGNGTFQPADQTLFAEQGGHGVWGAVVAGDFDGNGRLDLALSKAGCNLSRSHCGVSVFLGNGNGTFGAEHVYDSGVDAGSLVAGALHSGSTLDLIIRTPPGGLTVLNGRGDGTFQVGASYSTGFDDVDQIADINGDGNQDLVAPESILHTGEEVTATDVWLGNGNGTLQTPVSVSLDCHPRPVADFNGDGKPDIGCALNHNRGASFTSAVMLNATPPAG